MDALDSMDYELPLLRIHFPADPAYLADFGGVNAALYNPTEGAYTGVVDPRRGGLARGPRVVATPNTNTPAQAESIRSRGVN